MPSFSTHFQHFIMIIMNRILYYTMLYYKYCLIVYHCLSILYYLAILYFIFFDHSFAYCRLPCHKNFTVQNEHCVLKNMWQINHFDFEQWTQLRHAPLRPCRGSQWEDHPGWRHVVRRAGTPTQSSLHSHTLTLVLSLLVYTCNTC